MTDVLLIQTNDDGDLSLTDQAIETTTGLETAAYLSMFGANEDDVDWWGNLCTTDPAQQYKGLTAKAINQAVITSSRLLPIKDAVLADLNWIKNRYAEELDVAVTIPRVNTIRISVNIDGQVLEFNQAGPLQ